MLNIAGNSIPMVVSMPQSPSNVVVRFAPSPTGFLHIGGARTALFNWLFARHYGGCFRLRIEDTDRARSTQAAIDAIFDGLKWLGLDWDDDVVFQSRRAARHVGIAQQLLDKGRAYRCYCTPEELDEMRRLARAEGRSMRYDRRWRDRDPAEAPRDTPYVIRFKAPRDGETVIDDRVQGPVRFANDQLDDLVMLRTDGTPTYMLSVVVDDHDMRVTHVIRGDDHLTNAARQTQIYQALGWAAPEFAHIPLIHGTDGAKLSKRHGALGVEAYRDMGYLPDALRNYLLRLGWAHGDDEIISTEQAIAWFTLEAVGKSPARFDLSKLDHLNGHYMRAADDARLCELVSPRLEALRGGPLAPLHRTRLKQLMPALKARARTLIELAENAAFLVRERPLIMDEKAARLLGDEGRALAAEAGAALADAGPWTAPSLETALRSFADEKGVKFSRIAQPLRAALTGQTVSPGIFDVLVVLGRDESLARINEAVAPADSVSFP